jgi:small-conductance mechanosensitive channel
LFISALVAAVLVWTLVRRVLERLLADAMVRWLPVGRLRRSALAVSVSLATLGTIAGSVSLLRWGLESSAELGTDLASLTNHILALVVFSAFISGLGRAMLMLQRPSWRLPPIPTKWPAPGLVPQGAGPGADGDAHHGAHEQRDRRQPGADGGRQRPDRAGGGAVRGALLRYRRTLRKHGLERPTGLAGLIPFVMVIWVVAILLALLTGYLTLAYFLTAKLLWISVVTCAYLLTTVFGDLCETLLSPRQPGGLALASTLGLAPAPPGPGQHHPGRHRPHGRAVPGALLVLMPSGTSPANCC